MKKIEKFVLNENAEILDDEKMKLLIGGNSYHCRCTASCGCEIEADIEAGSALEAKNCIENICVGFISCAYVNYG